MKEGWLEKKDWLVGIGGMIVGVGVAGLLMKGLKN